jgi:hypothetical protein
MGERPADQKSEGEPVGAYRKSMTKSSGRVKAASRRPSGSSQESRGRARTPGGAGSTRSRRWRSGRGCHGHRCACRGAHPVPRSTGWRWRGRRGRRTDPGSSRARNRGQTDAVEIQAQISGQDFRRHRLAGPTIASEQDDEAGPAILRRTSSSFILRLARLPSKSSRPAAPKRSRPRSSC